MKKNIILVVFAFGIFYNYSCSQMNPGSAKMSTAEDTLAYAYGMVIGENFGKNFSQETVNGAAMAKGVTDVLNEETVLTFEEANIFLQNYFNKVQEEVAKAADVENLKEFKESYDQEGWTELDNGLIYQVMAQGDGAVPVPGQKVKAHYTGTLLDGTKFDSSVDRGEPFTFTVGQGVIEGWSLIVQEMKVGSKYKVFIPSNLAYGNRVRQGGPIPPNAALIFEIELLDIVE